MKASEAREQWAELLNNVFRNQTRIVVEKSGIPVAAVISAEDLERLTKLEKQRAMRFKALDEIGEVFKEVPVKQLLSEVSSALNDVRTAKRKEKN
ncbi:MAG: type II toxin-antitoxin system prevent-host-death family antitoxin [bacterium]|nr:type II toxin-antitoxin system prevent-host-death family antitoxin [bacterium]